MQNASEDLRNDREVVMKAVQKDGYALEYASYELRNDVEIVIAAIQQRNILCSTHQKICEMMERF